MLGLLIFGVSFAVIGATVAAVQHNINNFKNVLMVVTHFFCKKIILHSKRHHQNKNHKYSIWIITNGICDLFLDNTMVYVFSP